MGQGFGIFINFCNSWTELPHAAPVIEAQEARKRMRISSHPQRTHFQSLAIVRFGFDVSRLAKVLRWLAYVDCYHWFVAPERLHRPCSLAHSRCVAWPSQPNLAVRMLLQYVAMLLASLPHETSYIVNACICFV